MRRLLYLILLGLLIAGCGGRSPSQQRTPAPAETDPQQAAAQVTALPSPTSHTQKPATQPTSPALSAPPALPDRFEAPLDDTPRLPSGWTTYSNPDFVRGITVHDGRLWAATLGGVVSWDLATRASRLYTTRDGLVEIEGNDVVYCSKPHEQIIVAHEEGSLSAYNLALGKWSRIPISFEGGGTLKGVRTLFCDAANNRLLAGSTTEVGILHLDTMLWSRLVTEHELKLEHLRAIDVVGQAIWLAADKQGAMMVMGGSVFPFNANSGFPAGPVNDLVVGEDQSLWFGYPNSLVRYKDRKWNPYSVLAPRGIPFSSIDYVEMGPDNRVWVAGKTEGVCLFDALRGECSPLYHSPEEFPITDLFVSADGTPFAATAGGGVLGLYPGELRTFAMKQGKLAGNHVRDLAESQDGLLWIATDQGVNVLNPEQPNEPWHFIKPQPGRAAVSAVSGLQPADNGMWFYYDQEPRASFFDGAEWFNLDSTQGLAGPVDVSAVDWLGRIWLGMDGEIMLWSDSMLRPYRPPENLRPNAVQTFLADQNGMWVGTDRGLLRYERYKWEPEPVLSGFSVYAIAEDQNGGLLLGTDKGLVRRQGGQAFVWVIDLGHEVVYETQVTSVALDGAGHLWVGTAEKGLLMYNGESWEQFNTSNGVLPSNHVRQIYRDRLGTVWIVASTGPEGGALVRYVP